MEPQQHHFYIKPPLPNATTVLVLGIVSIPTCFCYGVVGLACGIIALVLAKKDIERYMDNPQHYSHASYSNIQGGKVCAIIGVALSSFFTLAFIFQAFRSVTRVWH